MGVGTSWTLFNPLPRGVSPCAHYSPGAGWGRAAGVWICHSTPGQCEPSVEGLASELWAQQGPGSREDQQRWLPGS